VGIFIGGLVWLFAKMNSVQRLNQAIQTALLRSNPFLYGQLPYLELLYQPTFTDSFLLQLIWEADAIRWHRTTWQKQQDRATLDLWLAYLEQNGEILPLELTYGRESGSHEGLPIKLLAAKIKALAVVPTIPWAETPAWGRDGEEIVLKIGNENFDATFHWFSCAAPTAWTPLEELVKKILFINGKLL
jgi:hypothetical protein